MLCKEHRTFASSSIVQRNGVRCTKYSAKTMFIWHWCVWWMMSYIYNDEAGICIKLTPKYYHSFHVHMIVCVRFLIRFYTYTCSEQSHANWHTYTHNTKTKGIKEIFTHTQIESFFCWWCTRISCWCWCLGSRLALYMRSIWLYAYSVHIYRCVLFVRSFYVRSECPTERLKQK